MIYCVCSWNDNYDFHHSDVATAWHFADALISAGHPATVLWGGQNETVKGVPHENYHVAHLGTDDTLIAFGGAWRTAIEGRDAYTGAFEGWKDAMRRGQAIGATFDNLRGAGRKWWYAYDYAGGQLYGAWERVFIESYVRADEVQQRTPDATVHQCMPGVVHDIDLSKPSPYPAGVRPLFFAGRLMVYSQDWYEGQLYFLRNLMEELPHDYHLWLVSASISVPPCFPGAMYNTRDVPQSVVGKTIHVIGEPGSAPTCSGTDMIVSKEDGIRIVSAIIGLPSRVHFLGPQDYQGFWHYYHHAQACLDFGLSFLPPAPNCKVLDPLRAGAPVIADGLSPSHYLIHKHRAGTAVPYRDYQAMAEAIVNRPVDTQAEKLARAQRVTAAESWRTRIHRVIKETGL